MKRLVLLSLLGLSLFFFSCNQGNDGKGQEKTEDPHLVLKYLKIHGKEIDDLSKLEVTLGKDKTQVTQTDVVAKFDYGKVTDKKLDVEVANGSLQVGDNIIKLSVKALKGQYQAWEKNVKVIIEKKAVDLRLKSLKLYEGKKEEVEVDISTDSYSCEIPSKFKNITSDDIKATFELAPGRITVIPLTVQNCPAELEPGKPTTIHLIAPQSQDEYNKWEHDLTVTRKALPQVSSTITGFAVNGDEYQVSEVKKERTFESNIKKPVVSLLTDRMFSKIESVAFDVTYPDNYKKEAALTLKEDLVYGTPIACTIDVTTKDPDQDRDDTPIKLEFSLTLKKGELSILSVAIGNNKVEAQDGTLNASSTPTEIQVNFKIENVIGLQATLEKKDGTNKIKGKVLAPIATFSSFALEEGVTEFVARASAENAEPASFRFKVNYTKPQADKVNIIQVKLDEASISQDAEVTTGKSTGAEVKIYLDKEYEKASVTINDDATTNPFPANKKLFQGTLQGLVEDTKTLITIKASAKDKTPTTFTFYVTYKKPAQKLVSKILAAGNKDYDEEGYTLQFATLDDEGNNTFSTSLRGLKLQEFKVEIADLQGKEADKLKIELSSGNEKKEASFVLDGSTYIANVNSIPSPLNELKDATVTAFTLKLLYNDVPIETYTLNIKGSDE